MSNTPMIKGIRATLPLGLSVASYGSILGMLACAKGLTWTELLLMNVSIFAGSAQFVMIDMWAHPLAVLEITIAVFTINLRYLLIGASLNPVFKGASFIEKAVVMHFVADENWAVTMAAKRQGVASIGYLFGGGLFLFFIWSTGTLIGHRIGSFIENPGVYALDFAFIAVFTALTVSMWKGKTDLIPWITAAAISVLTEQLIPGKWYIVTGGVSGALVAAASTGLSLKKAA